MRTVDRTSKIVVSALSVLVGISLAAGCGDDGDGGGGDVTTGIAPTKLLSDVTDEEAQSACTRLQAGFDRALDEDKLIRAICTLTGAAIADTTADCNTFRDQCIEEANMAGSEVMEGLDEIDTSPCDGGGDFASCTGTVGQLETCANDMLESFEALLNQFSCDDAATVSEEDLENFGGSVAEPPASCDAVGCPEGTFFSAGEENAP